MDHRLIDKLIDRKKEGTYRSLSCFQGLSDFYSNDYLGLAQSVEKQCYYGSTGSRLISGNSEQYLQNERKFAYHFAAETALFFDSGYTANLGFFGCVPQRGDTVIYDEEIHASVHDGLRLSFCSSMSFQHNNMADLERKMKAVKGTMYLVVEGLYSMSGSFAPLEKIIALIEKYPNGYLIIDEAHSAGIAGHEFKGISTPFSNHPQVLARLVTFGKAYGCQGAVWLTSAVMRNYLINFCRPFIYSTAPALHAVTTALSQVKQTDLVKRNAQLQENINQFIGQFSTKYQNKLNSDPTSPIQMVRISEIDKLQKTAQQMIEVGLAVKPIFSPTVKAGNEGIRISLHSFNTTDDITRLTKLLSKIL